MTMDDIPLHAGHHGGGHRPINELQKSIKGNKVISFLEGGRNEQGPGKSA